MPDTKPSLIKILINRQLEQDLTNTAFAKKLGVSRTLWVMTRNGRRNVNITLLRAVAREFPELDDEILAFLRPAKGGGDQQ